ncbi:calcium/sodium antiporter [Rhodobacteraceae bacterium CCMM004]|nr:calcium/sodium antiporter [Rhodobacteraceae bacterium CCMM004]
MSVVFVIAGLALLLLGGHFLVGAAVALATRLGLSPLFIGLTVVGFGTSAPELAASISAALAGAPGIAVGNVVGSNIANILLILGLSALLAPIAVGQAAFLRDAAALTAATLGTAAVLATGVVGPVAGGAALALLALYLIATARSERGASAEAEVPGDTSLTRAVGGFVLGLGGILAGARLTVDGATDLAAQAGISEAVIGLTVVAVGTSLPELVTSVVAARRGAGAVALGNVLGSNIFNLLGILGATALVAPLTVPDGMGRDIVAMIAATALMIWVARSGHTITRAEGGVMVGLYAAYLGWLAVQAL